MGSERMVIVMILPYQKTSYVYFYTAKININKITTHKYSQYPSHSKYSTGYQTSPLKHSISEAHYADQYISFSTNQIQPTPSLVDFNNSNLLKEPHHNYF